MDPIERYSAGLSTLLEEKIAAARSDFGAFFEFVFRDAEGNAVKMASIHHVWQMHIEYCWKKGLIPAVLAPWAHAKTSVLTVARTAYEIGRNINIRAKIICQNDAKAMERVMGISSLISSPRYKLVFPGVREVTKEAAKSRRSIARWTQHELFIQRPGFAIDPTIQAAGVLSAGTGGRADFECYDDVVDQKNAIDEPALRDKVANNIDNVWMSRLEPSGRVMFVGCVTPDTWVPTEKGLARIGELTPGPLVPQTLYDLNLNVFGRDGLRCATKYWVNGECDTIKVDLTRGQRIEGSYRHPVLIMSEDGHPTWRRLDELAVGDLVAVRLGGSFGSRIDLKEFKAIDRGNKRNRLDLPDSVTPDLAYLVGLWTSEGSFSKWKVGISNCDEEIRNWLLTHPFGMKWRANTSPGTEQTLVCSSPTFLDLLRYLGASVSKAPTKIVPARIMGSDRETVRAFLQGLYDGDGTVFSTTHSKGVTQQTYVGSTSEKLIRDVQILLLQFGIMSSLETRPKKPTKLCPHPNFDLWTARSVQQDAWKFLRDVGFRLTRKQKVFEKMSHSQGWRLIPNQSPLISSLRRKNPGNIPGVNLSEVTKNRFTKEHTLVRIVDWYAAKDPLAPELTILKENLNELSNVSWVPVKTLTQSRAFTVDFVVPDGASFVSNGIVSHNTPWHGDDYTHRIQVRSAWCVLRQYVSEDFKRIEQEVYNAPDDYPLPFAIRELQTQQTQTVESSNIASFAYDPGPMILDVQFKNGTRYYYYDVPKETYVSFTAATSKGAFFSQVIKGKFKYKKAEELLSNHNSYV